MAKERETAESAGGAPPLPPGLYFVATPIGAARDITLRALDILMGADLLAAEDTRRTRKILDLHGVKLNGRKLISYHDHSGPGARKALLEAARDGAVVAYVSDAGTPLVADPGFALAREAIATGAPVFAAPGASAVLAALVVSGLPSDRFLFAGFAPRSGRKAWLKAQLACRATLILYESPKRVHRILAELAEVAGQDVEMALCRELTKRHEEVLRGPISQVVDNIAGRDLKGEVVLVLGPVAPAEVSDVQIETEVGEVIGEMGVKAAASFVSDQLGVPRRRVYQLALGLASRNGDAS
ncbi:MAG: 16S rRNA (cytidine(1402)-2'-O)-methyltransferase [Pseudomonadota bacterium]